MKFRKFISIVFFFIGTTLFAFSLMPFFHNATPKTFWIMTVVGVVLMALCLVGIFYKPKEKPKLNAKYVRKDSIMSKPEREFLQMLREISPDKYEVIPQVALLDVIDKKTNASYRNELFRIIDYCFVDRKTFEPLLLVELNDNSHKRSDRIERDQKVAAICATAKLPLVTFWMSSDLSFYNVKKIVLRSILKK